jgi:hypothetical protein
MSARTPWTHKTSFRLRTSSMLAFTVLVNPGCADRSQPDFRGRPSEAPPVVVSVRNQHFADVTVYISPGGALWQRLGSVTGNTSTNLEIPSALTAPAGEYRIRVHAIGTPDATDYISDRILVDRGSVIELTVAPVLSMSSWSIRP